jgi:transposase
MRFYTRQHRFYCGVDLHARSMYVCVLNAEGNVLVSKDIAAAPEPFLELIAPYRENLAVAAECMFTWYWLADLCERERIVFVLGHALYMRAIHGGKAKNDRIDAHKIAALLRGGMLPQAYVYPQEMRATRDLMRRRNYLMRKRAELLVHIQNTNSQYNLPAFGARLAKPHLRREAADHFAEPSVRKSVALDVSLIDHYDRELPRLEDYIESSAHGHDPVALALVRTTPGMGQVLGLSILYEIQAIERFARVQDFVSYCRLVKPAKESAGKLLGHSGGKIGNAHLKWAFSEAAVCFLRANKPAQALRTRLAAKHGKGKSLAIIAARLARAVYFMLKRRTPFNANRFFAAKSSAEAKGSSPHRPTGASNKGRAARSRSTHVSVPASTHGDLGRKRMRPAVQPR